MTAHTIDTGTQTNGKNSAPPVACVPPSVELQRLSEQFQWLQVPTYIWQASGDDLVLVNANEAAEVFTKGHIAAIIGKRASQLYKHRGDIRTHLTHCLQKKTRVRIEGFPFRLVSSGEIKTLDVSYIFAAPDMVVVHTLDISERKQMENLQQRMVAILKEASDAVAMTDTDGQTLYLNQAARDLLEIADDKDVSSIPFSSFQPYWASKLVSEEGVAAAMSSGSWHGETAVISTDGREIPVSQVVIAHRNEFGAVEYLSTVIRNISERKQMEHSLRESEACYRLMFENNPHPMWVYDLQTGKFLAVNDAAIQHYGYTQTEFLAMTVRDIRPHEEASEPLEAVRHPAETTHSLGVWQHRKKDGALATVELTGHRIQFRGHNAEMVLVNDITERHQAEQRLTHSEQRFRALIEHSSDMVAIHDAGQVLRYLSPSVQRSLDYDAEELLGTTFADLVHPDDLALVEKALEQVMAQPGAPVCTEERLRHKDGRWCCFECTRTNFLENPAIDGIVVNARDITDRKHAEERLHLNAFYDSMTGLSNRALFLDHVGQAITRSKRQKNTSFAVLCLDLDRFKIINDSLGHGSGDRLLLAVARRLEKCVRYGDTVARLGGDEFAILLVDVKDITAVTRLAECIQQDLLRAIPVDGHDVSAPVSIGIVMGGAVAEGKDYDMAEDALRDADAAMSRAKLLGKGRYEIFDEKMQSKALSQLHIEHRLRRAIEKAEAGEPEFNLHYQPILSLQSGHMVGFEALLRWFPPDGEFVPPTEFIPVAEETGLVVPIGSWVMRKACHQMREWLTNWKALPTAGDWVNNLTMSVNVSSRQFAQPGLVDHIAGILQDTKLDARHLKLEITESVIMENATSAAAMLQEFRALGIRLSMDDFGTGYSSLAYLQRFPLDTLKIDRSFVGSMTSDKGGLEIVRLIMSLADNLGMDVVAEGIETADQKQKLQDLNCAYGQGYLFSKPVQSEAVSQYIQQTAYATRANGSGAYLN